MEVVMGRLPSSQASCSGVNGGVVLIVEGAGARETSNATTARNDGVEKNRQILK